MNSPVLDSDDCNVILYESSVKELIIGVLLRVNVFSFFYIISCEVFLRVFSFVYHCFCVDMFLTGSLIVYFTEPEFIQTPPSLIASACICAAIRGLKSPSAHMAPRDICQLTYCDPISLELVARHIEQIVDKETAAMQTPTKTPMHHSGNDILDSQPETPTDVQDIDF